MVDVREVATYLQTTFTVHGRRPKASERRHARSAINTTQAERSVVETQAERSVVETQADRRSVVLAMRTHCGHLGEMRQTETDFAIAPLKTCEKLP